MAHPYYQPKVVGRIELPDAPKKHECICDYCGNDVDDSWGDVRIDVYVETKHEDGSVTKETRKMCPDCEFEHFGDHEPSNIFDGTPNWMRMGY